MNLTIKYLSENLVGDYSSDNLVEDVMNLAPIPSILWVAYFLKQRTVLDPQILKRGWKPFFWHFLQLRAVRDF